MEFRPVFHGAVVKNSGKQLCFLLMGMVKQAVVNNKYILVPFISQRFHKAVDDIGGQQGGKAPPVSSGIIQETVNGIF